jgi:hypothetical protein
MDKQPRSMHEHMFLRSLLLQLQNRKCTRCRVLSEERAPIADEHRLLFDCQTTAGLRQRHVVLQATSLRDLMQHPDISHMSWLLLKCSTCVDNSIQG